MEVYRAIIGINGHRDHNSGAKQQVGNNKAFMVVYKHHAVTMTVGVSAGRAIIKVFRTY